MGVIAFSEVLLLMEEVVAVRTRELEQEVEGVEAVVYPLELVVKVRMVARGAAAAAQRQLVVIGELDI
jgi:hypothetical protein